jgi:hypothetical protein
VWRPGSPATLRLKWTASTPLRGTDTPCSGSAWCLGCTALGPRRGATSATGSPATHRGARRRPHRSAAAALADGTRQARRPGGIPRTILGEWATEKPGSGSDLVR